MCGLTLLRIFSSWNQAGRLTLNGMIAVPCSTTLITLITCHQGLLAHNRDCFIWIKSETI